MFTRACMYVYACPSVCLPVCRKQDRRPASALKAERLQRRPKWSERLRRHALGVVSRSRARSQRRHVLDLPRNAAPRKGTVTSAWRPRPSGRPASSSLDPSSLLLCLRGFFRLLAPPHHTLFLPIFPSPTTSSLSVSRLLSQSSLIIERGDIHTYIHISLIGRGSIERRRWAISSLHLSP